MPYLGEVAALTTALCWAVAALLFRQLSTHFNALSLNLYKGLIAGLGFLLVCIFSGFSDIHTNQIALLMLSGAIGIGLGDTAFFLALKHLDEKQTLTVAENMSVIFTLILAVTLIQEWLQLPQLMGIAIVLVSVHLVLHSEKKRQQSALSLVGIGYAILAAACQAIGAVISRKVLSEESLAPVEGSLWRILGGITFVVIMLAVTRTSIRARNNANNKTISTLFIATVVGTFIALWLQMVAFKHTEAAIVQTLFASCGIFAFIIALFRGHKIHTQSALGLVGAIAGVSLLLH